MPICEALNVTPEWLLSGVDAAGSREDGMDYYTVEKGTDMGRLITYYNKLKPFYRERVMGYVEAFTEMDDSADQYRKDSEKTR